MSRNSAARKMPALLTRTSMRPKAASVAATRRLDVGAARDVAARVPAPARLGRELARQRPRRPAASMSQSANVAPLSRTSVRTRRRCRCAAPVTTATRAAEVETCLAHARRPVEPDRDALRVQLEVEREQLADALVARASRRGRAGSQCTLRAPRFERIVAPGAARRERSRPPRSRRAGASSSAPRRGTSPTRP